METTCTCSVSRFIDPSIDPGSLKYLVDKLNNLQSGRKYLVLDDLSEKYLLLLYTYRECEEVVDETIELFGLSNSIKLVNILYDFKEYQTALKDLGEELKQAYNEKTYEEYRLLLDRRDRLLPFLSRYWIKDKGLFDKLLDCINRIPLGKEDILKSAVEIIIERNPLDYYLKKRFIEMIGSITHIDVDISIIWISDIIEEYRDYGEVLKLDHKLRSVYSMLRSRGCSRICIIDGDEYRVLVELTRLHRVVVI